MSFFGSSISQGNFLALLLFVFNFTIQDTQSSRVYGLQANIQDFPYIAAVEKCGATLLSERWIVTAAHCVNNPNLVQGKHVWISGGNFSVPLKFDEVFIHPEYQNFKPVGIPINDIALLRLERPLQLSEDVKPIKLPKTSISEELTYVFIGDEHDQNGETFKVIKKVELIRLTSQECISDLPYLHKRFIQRYLPTLERAIICTKRADDKPGVCMGDSGSPLVDNDTVVGLGSHVGSGDCHHIRIILFTNLIHYVPWIRSIADLQ